MLFAVGHSRRLDCLALRTVFHAIHSISFVQPALPFMVALGNVSLEPFGWTLDDGLRGKRYWDERLFQGQRRGQLRLGFPDSAEHSLPKLFCPGMGLELCLDPGYDRYCNSPYGGCCPSSRLILESIMRYILIIIHELFSLCRHYLFYQ